MVSLVLIPLMMFGSFLVQRLGQKVHDVNDRTFAVIDRTPGAPLARVVEDYVGLRNDEETFDPTTHQQVRSRYVIENLTPAQGTGAIDRQRFELSERVRRGQ